jgi:hypothetical protein
LTDAITGARIPTSEPCPQEFNIGPHQIDALYHYAKFQFECGNYSAASEFLYHYRTLSTDSERNLSALWGKLAAEILLQVGHLPGMPGLPQLLRSRVAADPDCPPAAWQRRQRHAVLFECQHCDILMTSCKLDTQLIPAIDHSW